MWQQTSTQESEKFRAAEKITQLAPKQFQCSKLSVLLALYVVLLCLTVCFANNFTNVFGMTLPGGIYVFPISFIICDIVGEVYGFGVARLFIWIGIAMELCFAGISELLILIPNAEFFQHGAAYETVFSPTIRYVLSGIAGFFFGEFLNIYILAKWKIKTSGRYFVIRSICTTGIGQALLSIIVDILAFYGKMDNTQLLKMMLSGWAVKMTYSLVFVLPAYLIVRHLKLHDKIDVYDTQTNFNPFRLMNNGSES